MMHALFGVLGAAVATVGFLLKLNAWQVRQEEQAKATRDLVDAHIEAQEKAAKGYVEDNPYQAQRGETHDKIAAVDARLGDARTEINRRIDDAKAELGRRIDELRADLRRIEDRRPT